jgi:hypothetical protein
MNDHRTAAQVTVNHRLSVIVTIATLHIVLANSVSAQVQQGLPPLVRPDYSFSKPDLRKAEDKSIERDAYGKPVKSPNDLKNEAANINKNGQSGLKDVSNAKDTSNAKDSKNLDKQSNKSTKDADNKKDSDKNKPLSEVGVRCYNCGTIIAVTEARKKAKPIWMSTSDPNEGATSEQSARNVEKADNKPSDEFQKSSSSPVAVGSAISRPNTGITLQRKLGFETIVRMEDGTLKTVVTSLQPAYNVGAKVRVVGNSLSPR